jgi:NADH-quinone oxidoreductase subunit N
MIEKLTLLHPEIALFVTLCVVLLLGLFRTDWVRRSTSWVTGAGLVVAALLAMNSPASDSPAMAGALLPDLLPFTKTMIALIALLILPVLAGSADRTLEKALANDPSLFDPMRVTRGEFYAFFLFSVMGVMLCASADDLIWLFLALELTSLPTYVMVAMSSPRLRSQEAGVKYFFLGAFGAAIFLYGFALMYGATGTTILPEMRAALVNDGSRDLFTVGLILAIIGVSFKIAAVPMHFYTPDVYQGASSAVAGYLAFAPKAAGFITLMLLLSVFGWTHGPESAALPEAVRITLWVMAALTMTVGNVLALLQSSVKRILAYSSIAHSGYMLVGLIAGPGLIGGAPSNGLGAVLFYLLAYGVMNLGAFAVLASLEQRVGREEFREVENLDDLRGLTRAYPELGWTMTLCALSLLGFPFAIGFFGKVFLFSSAVSAGEIVLVVIMAVNSAVAAFYYLRLAAYPLLEKRGDLAETPSLHPAFGRRFAGVLSAGGVITLLAFVGPISQATHRAAGVSGANTMNFEPRAEAEGNQRPNEGESARLEPVAESDDGE